MAGSSWCGSRSMRARDGRDKRARPPLAAGSRRRSAGHPGAPRDDAHGVRRRRALTGLSNGVEQDQPRAASRPTRRLVAQPPARGRARGSPRVRVTRLQDPRASAHSHDVAGRKAAVHELPPRARTGGRNCHPSRARRRVLAAIRRGRLRAGRIPTQGACYSRDVTGAPGLGARDRFGPGLGIETARASRLGRDSA